MDAPIKDSAEHVTLVVGRAYPSQEGGTDSKRERSRRQTSVKRRRSRRSGKS